MGVCPVCIPEERLALCVMFGVQVSCVEGTMLSPTERHVYSLWVENDAGRATRQVTVVGTKLTAWKAAIRELLSATPQKLW